ncbi:MAG: luciferase family protein [Haloarculaceae archaeon]
MRYFDEAIAGGVRTAFEDVVLGWPDVTTESALGCPAYFADGELFATLVTDGVVLVWLSDADRERLDRDFQTWPFSTDRGGDWVEVAIADGHALDSLLPFVRSSYDAARNHGQ